MPQDVERAQLDGFPVFWASAPGAFSAALMFRVGTADETLPTRGITHLVEHLAMFASGARVFETNGFVDYERCVFYGSGQRDEVLAWLRRCAAALCDLPLDRLATERRILRLEAATAQGPGAPGRLLDMRFGARSYGLGNYSELGLRWLGDQEVADWARTRFNRANAALWMTAEPPDGLDLPLPDGTRQPPPPVEPLPASERRFLADGTGGIALGGLGERSTALHAGVTIAADRLYQRLRVELGMVYASYVQYDTVGPERAHVVFGAECPDDQAPRVAEEVWRVATELEEAGVTEEELALHRSRLARTYAEPDAPLAALDHAAMQHLLGAEPTPRAQVIAELDALAPEDVAGPVTDAFAQALLLLPAGAQGLAGFMAMEPAWPPPVDGEAFAIGSGGEVRIGVGGVTLSPPGSEPMTLLWDELVLVERAPGATFVLHAYDGRWLELHLSQLVHGGRARHLLLPRLPAEILIPAGVAEATEKLEELAAAVPDVSRVSAELVALPRELSGDEMPEAVLVYGQGDERGLLALTDKRLLRLNLADPQGAGEAFARETIRGARVRKRMLRAPVLVVDADTPLELQVDDAARAEAFAQRLSPSRP